MEKEQEVLLAFALPMVVVGDAKSPTAIKEQRDGLLTAKLTAVGEDVNS